MRRPEKSSEMRAIESIAVFVSNCDHCPKTLYPDYDGCTKSGIEECGTMMALFCLKKLFRSVAGLAE